MEPTVSTFVPDQQNELIINATQSLHDKAVTGKTWVETTSTSKAHDQSPSANMLSAQLELVRAASALSYRSPHSMHP